MKDAASNHMNEQTSIVLMPTLKKTILFTAIILKAFLLVAQPNKLDSLWNDPAVEQRIRDGIERNRKGDFTLQLPARKGKAEIEIHQVKHGFLFGANIFMLNGFKEAEKNKRYEEVFTSLFNLACVPFYWKTLEPQQGQLRFAANSSFIYRRPPPDAVLKFCNEKGITPKGHTLVWDHPVHSIPDWLPKDTAAGKVIITNRIKQIGERYGNVIQTWDVVNEVLQTHPAIPLLHDYALNAFKDAAQYFPPSAKLMINEVTTDVWRRYHREYSPYYLLIQNLLSRGAKIDAIGLQFHFFNEQLHHDVLAGKTITPTDLFNVLDLYRRFGKPLHISEITLPTLPFNEEGMQNQAKLTRNFYRLWFSHPATEAIIWWNVADGTAVAGEDKWHGGFLNEDLSPKPAYHVLNELINKEWKTKFSKTVEGEKELSFRGFYGEYLIRIKQGKKITEQKVKWSKEGPKNIALNRL